jgi:hypothetical protein
MRKNLLKILAIAAILISGAVVLISHLNALPATWCRGTDFCDDILEACLEGEFVYHWPVGRFCYTWSICRSQFNVMCFDNDAKQYYYGYAYCDSPALWGECDPTQQ